MRDSFLNRNHEAATCDAVARFLFLSLDTSTLLGQLYMPMFSNGCLFIPSDSLPTLKQRIFLMLRLSDSNEETALIGRVVWLNPGTGNAPRLNKKGYGIQLESGAEKLADLIGRSDEAGPVE